MIRFKHFIMEAFFDAIKIGGQVVEIFENPSLKEIYEIKRGAIEFKFVIDFPNKKVFLWDGMSAHKEVVPFIKKQGELTGFDISRFYEKSTVVESDGFGNYLTGYCDSKTMKVHLDTLADIIEIYRPKIKQNAEVAGIFKSKFQTLLGFDYSWLDKFGFTGDDIKNAIKFELDENEIEV